jgi:hypothetical protein
MAITPRVLSLQAVSFFLSASNPTLRFCVEEPYCFPRKKFAYEPDCAEDHEQQSHWSALSWNNCQGKVCSDGRTDTTATGESTYAPQSAYRR